MSDPLDAMLADTKTRKNVDDELGIEGLEDGGAGSDSAPRTGKRETRGKSSATKSRTSSTSPRATAKEEKIVITKFEKELSEFFGGIGLIAQFGCMQCGQHVRNSAPKLAEVYNRLAEKDPRIKRFLQTLMTGGTISEAVTVTVFTIAPIAMHHNLIGRKRKDKHPIEENVDAILNADDQTLQDMLNADGQLT